MLSRLNFNSAVAKNVTRAFKEIHSRGVLHGDVRAENILVREDNSVVLIDFELSEIDADKETLKAEEREVQLLLQWWKQQQ
jgi:tRNA A-37 threonylcarbamoyl transferase component Bud32